MISIGPYKLTNRVALAPMAGVTDLPFRQLCHTWGAGLVVSEMINANPSLRDTPKTRLRSTHDDEIEPRSVQIAGNDPQQMAAAAKYNVQLGAQIIDINMGCPAKKVCRKAAGSALLGDESLVKDILLAVVEAVAVPVTLKIRTGISKDKRNGCSIARIAEDSGIQALAVHGRTRDCAFSGEAEYDSIASIVSAVDIPVYANGDIDSPAKAAAVLAHSGAAGVMVGRAAQGQPWICGQIASYLDTGVAHAAPDQQQQLSIMLGHIAQLHEFYGDYMGVRIARKHLGWYLKTIGLDQHHRQIFNRLSSAAEQMQFLSSGMLLSPAPEALAA